MAEHVLVKTLKCIGGEVTVFGDSNYKGGIEVAVLVLISDFADNLEKVLFLIYFSGAFL